MSISIARQLIVAMPNYKHLKPISELFLLDSMKDSSILLQDSKDLTDKERALDKRIHEIKEQNKAIVMRGREIEKDKKRYG